MLTLGCVLLLLVSALRHYARAATIPPVTWVLLAGLGYGLLVHATDWPALPRPTLEPEVTFHVFLPVLIFKASRKLRFKRLRSVAVDAALLATGGLLLTLGVLALGLGWLLDLAWADALLLAAALSPTDPLAIIAISKRLQLPERLRTLIEAESMFNDGSALVLFGIISARVFDRPAVVADWPLLGFALVMVGGLVVGVIAGWIGNQLLWRWRALHDPVIGALIPLITVYLTFFLAESLLHVSGVIAVMAAAVTLSALHRREDHHHPSSQRAERDRFFVQFWDVVDTVVNAILFFVLGVMIGGHDWNLAWLAVPALAVLLLVARGVGVYGGALLLAPTRWRVPAHGLHAINIAGLKGALTVAMLLALPEDYQHRQLFVCAAFALVLITLTINPLVGQWYLSRHEDTRVQAKPGEPGDGEHSPT